MNSLLQILVQVLVNNLIDQTAYTPQAKVYIRNVPVSMYNVSPLKGQWAEYTPEGGIKLNQEKVLGNPQQTLKILRHEMAHALDRNINAQYQCSTNKPASSLDFFQTFQNANPNEAIKLAQWLQNNGYHNLSPTGKDIETFAQYGSGGSYSLLSYPDIAKFYKDIYIPMDKDINYSPVFPSQEYQRRMLEY